MDIDYVTTKDDRSSPSDFHYGPGAHPGTGTPQSVHGGGGRTYNFPETMMYDHLKEDSVVLWGASGSKVYSAMSIDNGGIMYHKKLAIQEGFEGVSDFESRGYIGTFPDEGGSALVIYNIFNSSRDHAYENFDRILDEAEGRNPDLQDVPVAVYLSNDAGITGYMPAPEDFMDAPHMLYFVAHNETMAYKFALMWDAMDFHHGPGPHPGTGTPQSVHGGGGRRFISNYVDHEAAGVTAAEMEEMTNKVIDGFEAAGLPLPDHVTYTNDMIHFWDAIGGSMSRGELEVIDGAASFSEMLIYVKTGEDISPYQMDLTLKHEYGHLLFKTMPDKNLMSTWDFEPSVSYLNRKAIYTYYGKDHAAKKEYFADLYVAYAVGADPTGDFHWQRGGSFYGEVLNSNEVDDMNFLIDLMDEDYKQSFEEESGPVEYPVICGTELVFLTEEEIEDLPESAKVFEFHYGPGAHPGTGTPQSVHGHSRRIGKMRKAGKEQMVVLDADGNIIFDKTGTAGSISHTTEERMGVAMNTSDKVLIHNHPGGGVPSLADVDTMIRMGTNTMIVVTDSGDYVVGFNPILFGKEKRKIYKRITREVSPAKVEKNYGEKLWADVDDGMDYDDAALKWSNVAMDEALTKVARKSRGFNYVRIDPDQAEFMEFHYGPGAHPGTGTPQSVHGGGGGRVWAGTQQDKSVDAPSKLMTGKIGEQMGVAAGADVLGVELETLNGGINNSPIDLAGGNYLVEVKAGLASNGKTAQHWRATLGQPGVNERKAINKMGSTEKRSFLEWKRSLVMERKMDLVSDLSNVAGRELTPITMGVILSPDGTSGDVFVINGFHQRLPWQDYATDNNYVGTYELTD